MRAKGSGSVFSTARTLKRRVAKRACRPGLVASFPQVDAEADLTGIKAVEADAELVDTARKSVHEQAEVRRALKEDVMDGP